MLEGDVERVDVCPPDDPAGRHRRVGKDVADGRLAVRELEAEADR